MIDIGSSTGHKIGILLILTTLTIGSAAGLTLDKPSNGAEFNDTFNLAATNDTDSGSVDFWYKGSDESSFSNFDSGSFDGDGYANATFQVGSGVSSGDYDFKANSSYENTSTISITIDKEEPSVTFEDTDYVKDDPTISIDLSDTHTGVDSFSVSATGDASISDNGDFSSCNAGSTCTVDVVVDTSDLSAGDSFDLDVTATDGAGNEATPSEGYTFDNSYDAGTNPDFEYDDGSVFVLDDDSDDQTIDITVDGGDDENAPVRLTCYDGDDDQIDQSNYEDLGDSDESYTFSCEISADEDDYGGQSVDMYLEACDEAGNCGDESDTHTYHMDLDAPSVSDLEFSTDANLYNSNFDVEFSAFDSASDVEEVEYYFEEGVSEGEGTSFDSVDQDSYEIDTSELSEGDHTLYIRARDEADRWSTAETVDFSFDPDAVPEISLDVPQNVSVTAGEQGSFDVTIENTGDLFISSIELNGSSGDFFSDDESISDLEPGESITAPMEIDTESNNLGEHTIEISTDNPSMTEEIDLVVEANADQQDKIDSDLSDYQSKLQEMEANVTDLKQKVSEDKRKRLDSNFSKFKQKVESAQSAVESGDYYKAESILEGVDQDHSAAESTYEAVHKEYKNNQFWLFVFLGLGGVVVLGGGAIGALSYTDEVDFDVRDYLEDLQELEFDGGFFEKYADKFKRLLEGKDTSDAEDFKWDGFNNN